MSGYIVSCTNKWWPGWLTWAKLDHRKLYGEMLEYSCTYEAKYRTVFRTREEAEKCAAWLEKADRQIALKCKVEPCADTMPRGQKE